MTLWNLNLRHLRAAAEIRRLGSINAAASAVSLTQPAITQALARLEAQLGLQLFDRRHDGMAPVEAAELLAPRIETALGQLGSTRVTMSQMRALLALGEAGSYSAASAATGLSQPSLHRAVSDLSVALRRPLVERRGKGLAFTEGGKRTLRSFRLARAELVAGLTEVEGLKGREIGQITIGAMPLSRARVLPAAISAFHRENPEVRINVIEGSWHELVEPLRDGDIDLMVGALRDPVPDPELVQTPLFDDRPVVIGRKGHPLVGKVVDIHMLAGFPWTVAASGAPLRAQWEGMFSGQGANIPSVPIECGSVMMIRQILIDSDFLTLLSRYQVAVELEAGWLQVICAAPSNLVRTIGITKRSGWRPTAKQVAFIDQLYATSHKTIPEKL
jgi:LysR family transcriptional regulator, regulator for genes of the gallate degradation pathway